MRTNRRALDTTTTAVCLRMRFISLLGRHLDWSVIATHSCVLSASRHMGRR
jgi:hypothetical protein